MTADPIGQASSYPKITSAELTVRTADGQVRVYEFNGDDHDIRVSLHLGHDRELTIDGSLHVDRPIILGWKRIVATLIATEGFGEKPLLTIHAAPSEDSVA